MATRDILFANRFEAHRQNHVRFMRKFVSARFNQGDLNLEPKLAAEVASMPLDALAIESANTLLVTNAAASVPIVAVTEGAAGTR
jgi:hypothetical protein